MPALESVSSDTDGSEDEDTNVDIDEEALTVGLSDDIESASVSANPSEEPASITVEQSGSDARSGVPDLEVAVEQDTPPSVTATMTRNIGSKNGRPSDAFTTDGRGRVISVGDTPLVVPPHSQSGRDEVQPESSASPATANVGRAETRRGILGWLGSLV